MTNTGQTGEGNKGARDGRAVLHRGDTVFLHSLWRSSSTYFWQKLRDDPRNYCYCEPFHERLSKLTTAELDRFSSSTVKSLNHPVLSAPYFEEYRGLIKARGVRRYRERFALQDFVVAEGERNEALFDYVSSLIDHARDLDRRPVLQFCRSPMRVAWLQRHFGGTHVALLRNPRHQWMSFLAQARKGNKYFLGCVLALAGLCRDRALFQPLRERVYLPAYRFEDVDVFDFYATYAETIGLEESYLVFYYVWLASAAQSLAVSDIVLDVDGLSADQELRDRCVARLSEYGLSVELSDLSPSSYDTVTVNGVCPDTIEAEATALLSGAVDPGSFGTGGLKERLPWLSTPNRNRLEELLSGDARQDLAAGKAGAAGSREARIDRALRDLWRSYGTGWGYHFANKPVNADVIRWCERLLRLRETKSEAWVREQLARHKDLSVAQYRNMLLESSGIADRPAQVLFRPSVFGFAPVKAEALIWCYRLFLLREPETPEAIDRHMARSRFWPLRLLIYRFLTSEEFLEIKSDI